MEEQFKRRVRLAQDRTHLANERTLLAYWRTALAFFALGAFLIRFVPSGNFLSLGVITILFGIILFFYGIIKYFYHKRRIDKI